MKTFNTNILSNRGFSAIEIITTVVIVGMLSSLVVPGFKGMLGKYQLDSATREIVTDISKARMSAIKENKLFRVAFIDNATYTIAADNDKNGTFEADEIITLKHVTDMQKNVSVSANKFLLLFPRGTTDASVIKVNHGNNSKNILVNIAGKIKIES